MKQEIKQRISAFVQLGKVFGELAKDQDWPGFDCGLTNDEWNGFKLLIESEYQYNGWFTPQNVKNALESWSLALTEDNLLQFTTPYLSTLDSNPTKTVAIICAGNIPMVGWHDVLCTLLANHKCLIKLSSDDQNLIPASLIVLAKFWPEVQEKYAFERGKLSQFDAVIATGSNNTSRFFHQYFGNYPHIIRKSRTSLAILDGSESNEELADLGKDIFSYFGLGCRNISKIYVPKGYDLNHIFAAIYPFHPIVNHNKYANNYDYNKALWMLNQDELIENGFILFKEDDRLNAPTGAMYYEFYDNEIDLRNRLDSMKEDIQCIVSKKDIPFGMTQCPMLWDFADGVDTMQFLANLR